VAEPSTVAPVTAMIGQYAQHASPLAGLEATVLSALGGRDAGGDALASDLELDNAFAALALTRLAGPSLGAAVPRELQHAVAQLFARADAAAGVEVAPPVEQEVVVDPAVVEPASHERFAELEKMVADLSKKVTAQARTITTMKKQIKSP
jgi:hypothetical protein